MSIQWILVKYVEDLARNEPRNVGVILRHDQGVYFRFLGEDAAGKIDGRRARAIVSSVPNYKAWTEHWREDLLAHVPHDAHDFAQYSCGYADGNYRLEFGGERLWGEISSPEVVLSELFGQLVAPVQKEKPREVARVSAGKKRLKKEGIKVFVQEGFKPSEAWMTTTHKGAFAALEPVSQYIGSAQSGLLLLEPLLASRRDFEGDIQEVTTRFGAYKWFLQKAKKNHTTLVAYVFDGDEKARQLAAKHIESADKVLDLEDEEDREKFEAALIKTEKELTIWEEAHADGD